MNAGMSQHPPFNHVFLDFHPTLKRTGHWNIMISWLTKKFWTSDPRWLLGHAGPRSFIHFPSHSHVYPPEFWELTAFLFFFLGYFRILEQLGSIFRPQKWPGASPIPSSQSGAPPWPLMPSAWWPPLECQAGDWNLLKRIVTWGSPSLGNPHM